MRRQLSRFWGESELSSQPLSSKSAPASLHVFQPRVSFVLKNIRNGEFGRREVENLKISKNGLGILVGISTTQLEDLGPM